MTVTQEKSDTIRFVCREEDLGGVKPSDEGFEDAFRQKAMEVLQGNGFTVDPNTFLVYCSSSIVIDTLLNF
jgi:hypothetical protein